MAGIPRIGDTAPDFSANTTEGPIDLSSWQDGKWVLFFSHPADFTPVCTTELAELARLNGEFERRNVKLLGLSVDSVHSHLAWLESIRDRLRVEVPFPLIADVDARVAQLYGMIHPEESSTATVRAAFVIDPSRMVRALVYYPLSVGRNIDELLRLVDSLQATTANAVATPANWRPGEKVVVPPTTTVQSRKERLQEQELEHVAPYLAYKSL